MERVMEKMPRRVRGAHDAKVFDHFLTRRVRGKKYFSACKRANEVSALQQTAAFSNKWRSHLFDGIHDGEVV